MRFHCPKCDTKYRITEDKLAERPAAKMRCKECTTVFSVQDAIAAEGQRASEASSPGVDVVAPEQGVLSRVPSVPAPASVAGLAEVAAAPAVEAANPLQRSALPTRPIGTRPSDRPLGASGVLPSPLAPSVLAQALGPKTPAAGAAGLGTPRLGSPTSVARVNPLAAAKDAAASVHPVPARTLADGLKPPGVSAALPKPLLGSPGGLAPRPTPLGKPGLGGPGPLGNGLTGTGPTGAGLIGTKAPFGRGPVGETVTALVPEPAPKRESTPPTGGDSDNAAKPESRSSLPGPALGRGSASAFPPVTAERTLPVVPPFHPAPTPSVSSLAAPASLSSTSEAGAPQARETSLGAATPESGAPTDPGATPRVPNSATDDSRGPMSSGPWASNVNAPSAPPPGMDAVARGFSAESPATAKTRESPIFAAVEAVPNVDLRLEPVSEISAAHARPRARVVSLAVAAVVSLVFGAGGFASGYLLGLSKPAEFGAAVVASGAEPGGASALPAAPVSPEAASVVNRGPAPPPPPPLESAPLVTEPAANLADAHKAKKASERKSEEAAAAAPEGQPATSSGASSLSGLGMAFGPGPVAGPAGGGASSGAGLEAAAIQSTVQKNQNAVKRSCWQPALNGRAADAPSTARVTTTIQISPDGTVSSVKHSGEPRGYPGLGRCIVARLKGWTFPKSNGSTTANIPFVFAAQ